MSNALVSVRSYRNGGPRSYETFRVCWSVVPTLPAERLDMRTREARHAAQLGLCGVRYCQGAQRRNASRWYAEQRIADAELQQLGQSCQALSPALAAWLEQRDGLNG